MAAVIFPKRLKKFQPSIKFDHDVYFVPEVGPARNCDDTIFKDVLPRKPVT